MPRFHITSDKLNGTETVILMDGKPLEGVRSISIDMSVQTLNVIVVEFHGLVDIDAELLPFFLKEYSNDSALPPYSGDPDDPEPQ